MKGEKLISIFTSLTKEEIRKAEKFIKTSSGENSNVYLLFKFMRKNISDLENNILGEECFSLFEAEKSKANSKIRLLIFQLVNQLESFLVKQYLEDNVIERDLILLKEYQKRKIKKPFNSKWNKINTKGAEHLERNPKYYYNRFQLEAERYAFAHLGNRFQEFNLKEINENLNIYVISEYMRWAIVNVSLQGIKKQDYSLPILEPILKLLEKDKGYLKNPAVNLYFYGFQAYKNADETSYFNEFKKMLFKNGRFMSQEELFDFYVLAFNLCIYNVNRGNLEYLEEFLKLVNEGIKNKALLIDDSIPYGTYRNIVYAGLKLKRFSWAEEFIYKYKDNLNSEYKEQIFNLNMARFSYEKKDYEKAIFYLQDAETEDKLNNLAGRLILLKIYYETKAEKALDSFLHTFRMYLIRRKELTYHKKRYLKIIRFTEKLMKVNPYDKAAVQKLKDKIETEENFPEKDWLLDQTQKLLTQPV